MRNPIENIKQVLRAGVAILVSSVALDAHAQYSNAVAAFNPLAYWRLNEAAGSPALNTVANSGTLGSAADGFIVGSTVKGVAGIVGNAVSFSNPGGVGFANGHVDVTYSAALNPNPPFSVEFWYKPDSLGADATGDCIITSLDGNGFSGGNRSGWVCYVSDTGRYRFWLGLTGGYAAQPVTTAGPVAAIGVWQHVVATYDGATIKIYVNGILGISSNSVAATSGWKQQTQTPLRMSGTMLTGSLGPAGSRPSTAGTSPTGNRGARGSLDEVAIYNTLLSASQVAAHHAAATTNNAGYAAQINLDSPLLHLQMNETAPTPPALSSLPLAMNSGSLGSAADGTNMWGTLNGQSGAAYAGFEAGNNAVHFDGHNGSLDLQDAAGLHFSGNITMMAWVKPNARDYYRNILAHGLDDVRREVFLRISRSDDTTLGGTTTNYYEVGVANGVTPGFNLIIPGGGANYYHAARFPMQLGDVGNWVFLAGTYDGANWNLYRNGALVATYASVNGAYDVTNRWSIGSRADPSPILAPPWDPRFFAMCGQRFGGSIDEPAIFNTALSAADILSLYNAANVPPFFTSGMANPSPVFKGGSPSFSVVVDGNATISYQWYSNGVAVGSSVANHTVNNIQVGVQTIGVVAANAYGTASNGVTFTVVAAPPSFTVQPVAVSKYTGQPFSFNVTVAGSTPMSLQWQRNSVDIPGQTSSTYAGTTTAGTAGSIRCVASNEVTVVNSTTVALAEITPPTGYGATVLADSPVAYWRLGELSGSTAFDYQSGRNGTYFSASLNQAGYSALDPDTAAQFNGVNSYVGNINGNPATGGINFEGHVNFSLEAWVNAPPGLAGESTIIAKGTGSAGTTASEQFSLDVASNPGAGGDLTYHFYTRGGNNSYFEAFADVGPSGNWDHVVGVYDDLNVLGLGTNMHIFVNGELRGSGATRANGLRANSTPVSIGSKRLGNSANFDGTFNGLIDEVAVYSYALTVLQVSNHYATAYGVSTAPTITKQPVSQTAYASSPVPVKFEVAAFGSQPLTYQWKQGSGDLVDGGNIAGATTRALTIFPVSAADATNYSVRINNLVGPVTNSAVVTLTVIPAPTGNVNVPGLVLHLPFNGSLSDASGRGNHGTGMRTTYTSTNTASPSGSNPDFNYVSDGALGQALHYRTATTNGGNGTVTNAYYVTLGDKPDLRFGSSVNFSVSYWIRFPDVISFPELGDLPVIASAINSYGNPGYTFAPSYNLGSWSYSLDGTAQLYGSDHLLSDYLWHHIVHTFNRSGVGITYVDGQQVDTRSITAVGDLDTGNPVSIGQDPTGIYPEEGNYDVDDIGIWRRALSSTEVVGIYLAATLANSSFVDITPRIAPGPSANQVTITWQAGVLQSATTVNGTYTDVVSATSPYTVTTSDKTFYRTRQ